MNEVTAAARPVHVVVPGDVDDPAVPSGGNAYDRRLIQGLAAAGRPVREIAVPGEWPRPGDAARAALADRLSGLPDGAPVLLDGLVACGVPEVVVPQARRLRLAVLVHLPLADESGLAPALATELDAAERETLRAARLVVTTSHRSARLLTGRHGLVADRVRVVPPGTDAAPPAPGTDGASRLLCVASVTERKGHDLLIDALASLADLPWSCVCAGPLGRDPGYAERVRKLAERHSLADRVRFTGPLVGESLDAAYAAADLVVLPSRAETYGMVVAEALARAIPVLATDVGGVPEALGSAPDGSLPGILVPPEDSAGLAAALEEWLRDPGLRHRLRASARMRRETTRGWRCAAREMAAELDRLGTERTENDGMAGVADTGYQGVPGAALFAPDWLAAREGADAEARATRLLDPLRGWLSGPRAPGGPLVVRDLGCGTGSMGRWLAGRLDGPQAWVLHDRDPGLLALAAAGMPDSAADGSPVTARTSEGDIGDLTADELSGTGLVTASALLDLLSADEVEALADACVAAGCPALLTLSVVGAVALRPADPLDAAIAAAFDAHQRRESGRRRLLGPDAVAITTWAFERRGAMVLTAPSPWQLGPDQASLLSEWLRGWVGAAVEQRPELAARAADYLRRRLDACAAGELRAVVGHRDLLALPASREGDTS